MNDKQIDELDRIIDNCVKGGFSSCEISKYLYEKGYRKQSDIIDGVAEILVDLPNIMNDSKFLCGYCPARFDCQGCCMGGDRKEAIKNWLEEQLKKLVNFAVNCKKSPHSSAGRTQSER